MLLKNIKLQEIIYNFRISNYKLMRKQIKRYGVNKTWHDLVSLYDGNQFTFLSIYTEYKRS